MAGDTVIEAVFREFEAADMLRVTITRIVVSDSALQGSIVAVPVTAEHHRMEQRPDAKPRAVHETAVLEDQLALHMHPEDWHELVRTRPRDHDPIEVLADGGYSVFGVRVYTG